MKYPKKYDEEDFWTDVEWLGNFSLEKDEAIDFLKNIIKKSGGKIKKNKEFMAKYIAEKV